MKKRMLALCCCLILTFFLLCFFHGLFGIRKSLQNSCIDQFFLIWC